MTKTRYKNGFTLIELLVALMITGIIASAVVTLAYAMNSAGLASDETSRKQAQVRFATTKISDLIRQSRLVCYVSTEELAVWAEDKNNNNIINLDEVTYIEAGAAHDHLQLYTFSDNTEISRDAIVALTTNWWSTYGSLNQPTLLIPECSNVTFFLDNTGSPPDSRLVSITFDIVENGISSRYQISGMLRGWAGHLLGAGGNIVPDDD